MDARPTEEKLAEEKFDAKSRVDGNRVAGQFGRLAKSRPASDYGLTERNHERRIESADRSRNRKTNARYQRKVRAQQQSLQDLQAQIRVASGETSASPALVANARKALEAKVNKVMQEVPDLTEQEAVQAVYEYAAGLR